MAMKREQLIARIMMALEELEPFGPGEHDRDRELNALDCMSDGELQDRFNEVVNATIEIRS